MSSESPSYGRPDDSNHSVFPHRGPAYDTESVIAALDDPDCRTLLEATTGEALTAQELVERCDVPRSTTYRKIDQLTEAGLLEEEIRLRRDGKHASEYRRAFEDVTITLSSGEGVEVGVSRAEPVAGD